jgi:cysteinyl-tRNA synthetase
MSAASLFMISRRVGHACTYAGFFDVMNRYLRSSGYITYVRNITDVDDKITVHRNGEARLPKPTGRLLLCM